MKLRRINRNLRDNNPWKFLPVSRSKSKRHIRQAWGIIPMNGQIGNVSMERVFNRPGWTKIERI